MLDASTERRSQSRPTGAQENGLFAALDLGTNNCRLLVAGASGVPHAENGALATPSLKVVDSFSRIVKLGEGVAEHGKFSEVAMGRTISALKMCRKKLARHRISAARFVATEACRKSSNSHEFVKRVEKETGIRLEIISGEEEARLAFLGCASLLSHTTSRAIVFDIGGGSTELMWIDADSAKQTKSGERASYGLSDWLSVDSGVMNLADRYGGSAFADLAYDDMVRFMETKIKPFDASNGISHAIGKSEVQMLSTSGTMTTLAAIHLDLPRYDRSKIDGLKLDVSDITAATKKLLSMRPSQRFNHPCIGADRADYIISGCAIFEAISNVWPAAEITVADRGVREGIIISLLKAHGR